jgi:hypothetical protein
MLSFYRPDVAMFPEKPYIPNRYVVPETWYDYNRERPIHRRERIEPEWPCESHIPEQARRYYTVEGLPGMDSELDLPPRERFFLATEGITTIKHYEGNSAYGPVLSSNEPPVALGNIDAIQDACHHPQAFRIAPRFLRQNPEEFELLPTTPDHAQDWEDDAPYWSQVTADYILNRTHTMFHQGTSHFGKAWNERSDEYKNGFRKFTQEREVFDEQEWQNWFAYVNSHYQECEAWQQWVAQRDASIENRTAKITRLISAVCEAQEALTELECHSTDGIQVPNEPTVFAVLSEKVADMNARLWSARYPTSMNGVPATAVPQHNCPEDIFDEPQDSGYTSEEPSHDIFSKRTISDPSDAGGSGLEHYSAAPNTSPVAKPSSDDQDKDRFDLEQIAVTFNSPFLAFDGVDSDTDEPQFTTTEDEFTEFGEVKILPVTTLSFKLSGRNPQRGRSHDRMSLYVNDFERDVKASFKCEPVQESVLSPPMSLGHSKVLPFRATTEKRKKLKDRVRAKMHHLREKLNLPKF